jgi:uncharacterized protein (DUF169 family)
MTDWGESAQALNTFIRPQTFPVSVKMVESADEFPERTRRPFRDMGFKSTICVAIALARKYGWTIGMTPEDNACPVAAYLYGWSDSEAENETILADFMKAMSYGTNDDAIKAIMEATKQFKLNKGQYAGVVFSPLELGRIDPDLVILFCNSAQLMRLVHGATREKGASLPSIFSGKFGVCNEGVLQTIKTKEPRVVLPGNGDRVWGMVQDDEFVFTIPGELLGQVIDGLEATHRTGIRYPIPIDIRHEPLFPPQLRIP